jgi:SAM-dependent methyltransferase
MLRRLTREPAKSVTSRGLIPLSRRSGWDRGQPIDRYYIDHFLKRHSGEDEYAPGDITGRVLEIGDSRYTRAHGKAVTQPDVFNLSQTSDEVTVVGDLTREEDMPEAAFDCIISTQTLLVVYDFRAALRSMVRGLKPGGVLLMTNPGISRVCRPDIDRWGDYWRFTSLSIRRLLEELLPAENVRVDSYGNVLTATAFLYGLASAELDEEDLKVHDPDFEVIVAARAVKPGG